MSRGWFLALAISIGLNAGLLWMHFADGAPPWRGHPLGARGGGHPLSRPGGPLGDRHLVENLAERHVERMTQQLDLTNEQQEAVRALMDDMMPRLKEFRERMMGARETVADAYRSRDLDEAGFRDVVHTLNRVKVELDSLTAEVMLEEAALLTPEQRERYADVMPWGFEPRGSRNGPGLPRRAGKGPPGAGRFGRDGGPPSDGVRPGGPPPGDPPPDSPPPGSS